MRKTEIFKHEIFKICFFFKLCTKCYGKLEEIFKKLVKIYKGCNENCTDPPRHKKSIFLRSFHNTLYLSCGIYHIQSYL